MKDQPGDTIEKLKIDERLLGARINDLEKQLKEQGTENDRELRIINSERATAMKKLARLQRRNADWSFQLQNGREVFVRFDGPGASDPGCPPNPVTEVEMRNRFFSALANAADGALYRSGS